MPLFLIPLLTWLRRAASLIPAWVYGALIVALAFGFEAYQAHRWHSRATVAETSLASVRATQLAVNKAAALNKTTKEAAATTATKENDYADATNLAALHADYAALRVRYEAARRAASGGAVSGPASPAKSADCAAGADVAIPATQLVDFAEQGDVWRQRIADIQAWYAAQASVDRTPTPR